MEVQLANIKKNQKQNKKGTGISINWQHEEDGIEINLTLMKGVSPLVLNGLHNADA